MIRVLQVTGMMNRGGAEVMLMDILRNKPSDVHFDFLINTAPEDFFSKGAFDDEILSYGCEMRYIGTQLRIGPRQYIKQFKNIYEELKPDVVHIHLNAKCGIIALAAHKAGCKHIISHCHANIKFHGSWLRNFLNNTEVFLQKFLISHYATDYWGCSLEANKRLYWPWIRKKSVVINNAIETLLYSQVDYDAVKKVRESYNFPENCIILGNVGRIVPHKNLAFIVDLLNELHKKGHDAALVVAGRNDAPQYVNAMMERAKEYSVDNRILLLGERSDIPVVMHSFDIFVGSSLQEGFGLVAVEAQAAGVPCVLFKGFPQTVNMNLGLCEFIDNFDVNIWIKTIQDIKSKSNNITVEDIMSSIKSKGFDAKENARSVSGMYEKMLM